VVVLALALVNRACAGAYEGLWEVGPFKNFQRIGDEESPDCLEAAAAYWEAETLKLHPGARQVYQAYLATNATKGASTEDCLSGDDPRSHFGVAGPRIELEIKP
jgi:hypothetical protein